ncbi:helicase associated domain-containing protein [Streptomyces phaeochromogenes]
MEALTEVDPGWCPAWEIAWQRNCRLALAHVKAGSSLPVEAGDLVVQGEALGVWIGAQRAGRDKPSGPVRRSQEERWAADVASARKFHAREGHVRPTRKHVELVNGEEIKLGVFLDHTRRRAAKLSAERRAQLAGLGLEYAAQEREREVEY